MSALGWRDYEDYQDEVDRVATRLQDELEWKGDQGVDDQAILSAARSMRNLMYEIIACIERGLEEG